jgi:hypothetical protein
MRKNMPKYVLIDDTYIPEYKEYVEYCRVNEIEPDDEDSQDYWDYVSEFQQMEWDDLSLNMAHAEQCKCPVIITGKLGLWNGSPDIYPVRCEDLYSAIRKCYGKDIDNLKAEVENGVVHVYAYHHDVTNHFQIYRLSKKGIKTTESWNNNTAPNEECKGYWLAKFHGYIF